VIWHRSLSRFPYFFYSFSHNTCFFSLFCFSLRCKRKKNSTNFDQRKIMRYIAAYLLLVLGGKAEPTEADISKLLSGAGVAVDEARLKAVHAALHGKPLEELVAAGQKKLAMVPSGGGAAAAPAGGAPAAGAAKGVLTQNEKNLFFVL
jgi:large subunit ribosomal protein LP2